MRLYYFSSERYALEALRDKRLKIARINELNDPFEFMGLALPKHERRVLRKTKDDLDKFMGIVCFSNSWSHPLLWSHYADNHKGLALGFETKEDKYFHKVNYVQERLTLRDIGLNRLEDFVDSNMMIILCTKFISWSYESEYRSFVKLDNCDCVTGLYFHDFFPNLELKEVIVGERSNLTRSKLSNILGDNFNSVVAKKARCGFRDFAVVENKLKRAWK